MGVFRYLLVLLVSLLVSGCGSLVQSTSSAQSSVDKDLTRAGLEKVEDGQEAFRESLALLREHDPSGEWYEDPFEDLSTNSSGVMLDGGSEYPSGCAAWWYNSKEELSNGILNNAESFFWTSTYYSWELPSGPAVILLANSKTDRCVDGFMSAMGFQIAKGFDIFDTSDKNESSSQSEVTNQGEAMLEEPAPEETASETESNNQGAASDLSENDNEGSGQEDSPEVDAGIGDEGEPDVSEEEKPEKWEPEFSFRPWEKFDSVISGCKYFACAVGQVLVEYTPPSSYSQLDVVFYSEGKLAGRNSLEIEQGDGSSLLDLRLDGIPVNGDNTLNVEVYERFTDNLLATEKMVVNVEMSPIEVLFAQNPDAFGNWSSRGNKEISDPFLIAEKLISAEICDRITDLGSRVRCSSTDSTGMAPGYDAYIYTKASDIVGLTQGYTYDNTVFYSSEWAISVYYPGWTASETDIVSRMNSLNWSVIGQDWRDPASCIGSCFVSRG